MAPGRQRGGGLVPALLTFCAALWLIGPAAAQDAGGAAATGAPAATERSARPPAPAWTRLPGQARDIAITASAQAYAVAPDGTARRWRAAEQRWSRMSGKFVRITGAEGNRPWGVTAEGIAMRYNGLWWEPKAESVADVAGDAEGSVIALRPAR